MLLPEAMKSEPEAMKHTPEAIKHTTEAMKHATEAIRPEYKSTKLLPEAMAHETNWAAH